MLNRWFHRPLFHSPALGLEKKVTWLELFFDLIFVAAFIQLGNFLSVSVTLGRFAAFAGVFVPLWVSWIGFTFYANRFTIDDITQPQGHINLCLIYGIFEQASSTMGST